MKTTLTAIILAMLAGGAFAGPYTSTPSYTPTTPQSELFAAGWHLGGHGLFLTPDADRADDTWGGGINLDYFVNPFIGFQASASWADPGTDEVWHNYLLDLVVRYPFESAHIAPYGFIGGGAILEDDANFLGRVGVGLEYRPVASFGIFTDWSYNFPDGPVEDYQMIRAGIKFGF